MLVEFNEEFDVPVEAAYEYFRTPADWPRLFPAFGEAKDLGEGWYSVPFSGFPFPLVSRITRDEPQRCVEWIIRGFWRGQARVEFMPTSGGVLIRGHERVSAHRLFWFAPLAERVFIEARFREVWESGWRRLRREAAGPDTSSAHSTG